MCSGRVSAQEQCSTTYLARRARSAGTKKILEICLNFRTRRRLVVMDTHLLESPVLVKPFGKPLQRVHRATVGPIHQHRKRHVLNRSLSRCQIGRGSQTTVTELDVIFQEFPSPQSADCRTRMSCDYVLDAGSCGPRTMCILGPLEIGSSTSGVCKRRSPRLGRRAFVSATTSPICAVSLAAAGFHLGRKLCRAVPPTLLSTTDPSVGHARMPPRALPAWPPGCLRNPHGSRARGPENALFPAGSEGSIQRRGPVPESHRASCSMRRFGDGARSGQCLACTESFRLAPEMSGTYDSI